MKEWFRIANGDGKQKAGCEAVGTYGHKAIDAQGHRAYLDIVRNRPQDEDQARDGPMVTDTGFFEWYSTGISSPGQGKRFPPENM